MHEVTLEGTYNPDFGKRGDQEEVMSQKPGGWVRFIWGIEDGSDRYRTLHFVTVTKNYLFQLSILLSLRNFDLQSICSWCFMRDGMSLDALSYVTELFGFLI